MNRNAAVGGKVSARDSGLGKPFLKSLEKKEEFGSLWDGFQKQGAGGTVLCEIPKAG